MTTNVHGRVHGVFAGNSYALLQQAGATRIVTCNTIAHPSNAIDISRLVAGAVAESLEVAGATVPGVEAAQ